MNDSLLVKPIQSNIEVRIIRVMKYSDTIRLWSKKFGKRFEDFLAESFYSFPPKPVYLITEMYNGNILPTDFYATYNLFSDCETYCRVNNCRIMQIPNGERSDLLITGIIPVEEKLERKTFRSAPEDYMSYNPTNDLDGIRKMRSSDPMKVISEMASNSDWQLQDQISHMISHYVGLARQESDIEKKDSYLRTAFEWKCKLFFLFNRFLHCTEEEKMKLCQTYPHIRGSVYKKAPKHQSSFAF